MHRALLITLLGAASLVCAGLLAQQAPVFRVGAEYVPVDVVVTDTNDVPITDLKADEFEIHESGRLQAISDFRFVSIPVAARDVTAIRPAAVVGDVVSNARLSPDSRLFVLLIDDLHMFDSDITAVRKVLSDFVRALSADDEVAVVFVGRPDLNLNFTTDTARALKAIELTREALGLGSSRDDRARTGPGREVTIALNNVARALADSTHLRRAIVYVSAGAPDLKDAFEAARMANVMTYSVDLRRLAANLTETVNAILEENGSFYVLGYYPSPPPRDGRFHPIDVRVTRPGARVRARAGYRSSGAGGPEPNAGDPISAAMASGVDMRGLTLRAHVAPLLPIGNGMRSTVTIQVTYPTVATDLPFDHVQVQVLALDNAGQVKARSNRGYTFKAPQSQREAATFLINGTIDLPAQALTLRIGVSSRALSRTGTLQLPVAVPKPSDAALQMGGVVIGLTGPARESAFGDDLVRGLVPFQPTTTRLFGQRSTLRVFAPLFWRGRDDVVKVMLTLRSADFVLQREESLKAVAQERGRQLTSLDTLIPLAKLAGPITLRIQARLVNGQTTEQIVGFDVRPPAGRGSSR
jgi:VWFA-related protein